MNSHKNARTTYEGRKLLIERIAVMGGTVSNFVCRAIHCRAAGGNVWQANRQAHFPQSSWIN